MMLQLGKRMRRKLRSNAGESIGETLVALLISALALVMLAGAISSTANMITTSDAKMGEYYDGDDVLVQQSSGAVASSVTIQGTKTAAQTRNISCYTNAAFASKPVVAYQYASAPAAGGADEEETP